MYNKLSALCIIRAFVLKDGKNVSGNCGDNQDWYFTIRVGELAPSTYIGYSSRSVLSLR